MYKVIANLEKHFKSASEAVAHYTDKLIQPVRTVYQSNVFPPTECISMAPTVEDYIMHIGLTPTFRRCLGANDRAISFAKEGRETYPIIILEFSNNQPFFTPSPTFVKDVTITNLRWLLKPAKAINVKLVWLDMYSIKWYCDWNQVCAVCKYTVAPKLGYHHPWIDGRGHYLDSDELEDS